MKTNLARILVAATAILGASPAFAVDSVFLRCGKSDARENVSFYSIGTAAFATGSRTSGGFVLFSRTVEGKSAQRDLVRFDEPSCVFDAADPLLHKCTLKLWSPSENAGESWSVETSRVKSVSGEEIRIQLTSPEGDSEMRIADPEKNCSVREFNPEVLR